MVPPGPRGGPALAVSRLPGQSTVRRAELDARLHGADPSHSGPAGCAQLHRTPAGLRAQVRPAVGRAEIARIEGDPAAAVRDRAGVGRNAGLHRNPGARERTLYQPPGEARETRGGAAI